MSIAKWIVGALGWAIGGPIGALFGYKLGQMLDNSDTEQNNYDGGVDSGARNSFIVSLLVLSSYIIKADGRILQDEVNYIREFIRRTFGNFAVPEAMQILDELLRQNIDIYECGQQISANMEYSQRMQLFNFLIGISKADGSVDQREIKALENVGIAIGISPDDINSMLSIGNNSINAAYKILEIEPTATNEEVRRAYKKLALKHHPDRVATLGADIQKASEEKFKKIGAAYELVCKERGYIVFPS